MDFYFGELRSIIFSMHGKRRWHNIVNLLNALPLDFVNDTMLYYIEQHLSHDSYLREMPFDWITFDGHDIHIHPAWSLVQDVDLSHRFVKGDDSLIALAKNVPLSNVIKLNLSYNHITGEGLECFKGLDLNKLVDLDLSLNPIGLRGVECVADLDVVCLNRLDLSSCKIDDFGFDLLLGSQRVMGLRDLVISHNGIDGSNLIDLLKGGKLPNLTHLDLSFNPIDENCFNGLSDLTMKLLSLSLAGLELNEDGLSCFVKSGIFKGLKELDLSFNDFGDGSVELLTQSPDLHDLTSLKLREVGLNDFNLINLLKGKNLPNLTRLDLSFNPMGESYFNNLSGLTMKLSSLSLAGLELTEDGLSCFVKSGLFKGLKELDLSYNNFGDKGVETLTQSPDVYGLTSLKLGGNSLAFNEAYFLEVFSGLEFLDLSYNELSSSGLIRVIECISCESLKYLNLSFNHIDAEFASFMANSKGLSNLVVLKLSLTGIGRSEFEFICKSNVFARLNELDVSHNLIDDYDVLMLSESELLERLYVLNLEDNKITATGVGYLEKSSKLSRLCQVSLIDNNIDNYRQMKILGLIHA